MYLGAAAPAGECKRTESIKELSSCSCSRSALITASAEFDMLYELYSVIKPHLKKLIHYYEEGSLI